MKKNLAMVLHLFFLLSSNNVLASRTIFLNEVINTAQQSNDLQEQEQLKQRKVKLEESLTKVFQANFKTTYYNIQLPNIEPHRLMFGSMYNICFTKDKIYIVFNVISKQKEGYEFTARVQEKYILNYPSEINNYMRYVYCTNDNFEWTSFSLPKDQYNNQIIVELDKNSSEIKKIASLVDNVMIRQLLYFNNNIYARIVEQNPKRKRPPQYVCQMRLNENEKNEKNEKEVTFQNKSEITKPNFRLHGHLVPIKNYMYLLGSKSDFGSLFVVDGDSNQQEITMKYVFDEEVFGYCTPWRIDNHESYIYDDVVHKVFDCEMSFRDYKKRTVDSIILRVIDTQDESNPKYSSKKSSIVINFFVPKGVVNPIYNVNIHNNKLYLLYRYTVENGECRIGMKVYDIFTQGLLSVWDDVDVGSQLSCKFIVDAQYVYIFNDDCLRIVDASTAQTMKTVHTINKNFSDIIGVNMDEYYIYVVCSANNAQSLCVHKMPRRDFVAQKIILNMAQKNVEETKVQLGRLEKNLNYAINVLGQILHLECE